MKKRDTTRVTVHVTSFEDLDASGWEPGDDGAEERAIYSSLVRRNLMSRLTQTQRRVIICLAEEGMERKKAARHLMVSLQSIHQIIARIKERFPEEDTRLVRNLAYLYWLVYPTADERAIERQWHNHPVLRDYHKPDSEQLATWYRRFEQAL